MKDDKRKSISPEGRPTSQSERHDDGVLDSLGKAIVAPIAGAAQDDLLVSEDVPSQRTGASSSSGASKQR